MKEESLRELHNKLEKVKEERLIHFRQGVKYWCRNGRKRRYPRKGRESLEYRELKTDRKKDRCSNNHRITRSDCFDPFRLNYDVITTRGRTSRE